MDIAGAGYGSPIYASNNGIVVASSYKWDNGEYIVINHNNGYYTLYAHLAERYVSVGQEVTHRSIQLVRWDKQDLPQEYIFTLDYGEAIHIVVVHLL